MKPSRPLALIKNIFGAYHQPLRVENNEEKLYKIITGSFRKQLDQQLGLQAEQSRDSQQVKAAKSFQETSNLTLSSPTDAPRAGLGSEHLRTILSNPLFSYDASKAKGLRVQGVKDPMDIFEEAAAKGLMTTLRAAGCLKAKHRQIMQSSAMDPITVMASSSAGQRVVEWLRSNGFEENFKFIRPNSPLLKQLMPFLIAEGMENMVWVWLDKLSQACNESSGKLQKIQQKQRVLLFESLVESKYEGAMSMNNAYACMAQAKETFPWPKEEEPPFYILSAWKKVAWESTVLAWKHVKKSSPNLFELFYSIGQDNFERQKLQLKQPADHYGIEVAHLALHHPTEPNAEQAVKLLLDSNRIWISWAKQNKLMQGPGTSPGKGTLRLRALGLDTVKVCASQGQIERARNLLDKMAPFLGQDFRMSIDDVPDFDEETLVENNMEFLYPDPSINFGR
ncbi:hypothetical protein MCOR25_009543 [Pyricularia grisea]|nr:hypothetical protein MCOR25_009543 [Pyricularia grisea]